MVEHVIIDPSLILSPADCHDPGPVARIAWRDKMELYTDDQYQRDMTSRRSVTLIDTISRKFNWKKFGILQTTERGAVIDGQHRWSAVLRRPDIQKVPCMIWDVPPKEAALMFVGTNRDRVNITPQAVFKAELKAGDPVAVAIKKVCDEAGVVPLTYSKSGKKLERNETTAIQTLKQQLSVNPKRCRDTLDCCLRAGVTLSSTILAMVFRELTLGSSVSRVMTMLGAGVANYIPAGHLDPNNVAIEAPVQNAPGVKRYESGTFMDILSKTFDRAGWRVEVRHDSSRWREASFKIDGQWVDLKGAVENANKLREASGFAPLSIPR